MIDVLDMTDVSMTQPLDFNEALTDADCTDCSSIIPRIGVRAETVPETELMTRPKTDLDSLDFNCASIVRHNRTTLKK